MFNQNRALSFINEYNIDLVNMILLEGFSRIEIEMISKTKFIISIDY